MYTYIHIYTRACACFEFSLDPDLQVYIILCHVHYGKRDLSYGKRDLLYGKRDLLYLQVYIILCRVHVVLYYSIVYCVVLRYIIIYCICIILYRVI